MTNSFHAKQYLSISSEEQIWVQLFHQLIQRKVNNMFLPGIGHRKCDFILGIEISHVTHFQRTETFPSRNEKTPTTQPPMKPARPNHQTLFLENHLSP